MASNKTPKRLLAMVCKYYGIGDAKKLASSSKLCLSLRWRRPILEDAKAVACWILRRHCDLSLEELMQCDALKALEWSAMDLEVGVARARRRLAEGDFAFRLGVENVEQMLLAMFTVKSNLSQT